LVGFHDDGCPQMRCTSRITCMLPRSQLSTTSEHMAPTMVAVAELSMPPDNGRKKPPALERRR